MQRIRRQNQEPFERGDAANISEKIRKLVNNSGNTVKVNSHGSQKNLVALTFSCRLVQVEEPVPDLTVHLGGAGEPGLRGQLSEPVVQHLLMVSGHPCTTKEPAFLKMSTHHQHSAQNKVAHFLKVRRGVKLCELVLLVQ